jgi:hypothetical protein
MVLSISVGSCPLRQCHLLFFLKASIYLINIYTPFFSAAKVHIKYNNSKLNRKIMPKTFGSSFTMPGDHG